MHRRNYALLFALAIFARTATAANPKIDIAFGDHAVTATGVSPGSTAVILGVGRVVIPDGYMSAVRRWAVAVDDTDKDGVVTLELNEHVPDVSVWVVVDVRNATYAIAPGSGIDIRPTDMNRPLRKGSGKDAVEFDFDHPYLDLLYIHPGKGAWYWSATGAKTSLASPPGRTRVSFAAGKVIAGRDAAPSSLVPGGILVAIDPVRLQIVATKVDQAFLDGAQ